jgi:hypothetical protein
MLTRFATFSRAFANRAKPLLIDAFTLLIGAVPYLVGLIVGLIVYVCLVAAAAAATGYTQGRGK